MPRSTVAEINLSALESNWTILKQLKNTQQLIPVIKANAYGHGVAAIADCLQSLGAVRCAVAMLEEALEIRNSGFRGSILVLGPIPKCDVSEIQRLACVPIIGDKDNLMELAESGFQGAIHVKWDTGMNRLGLKSGEEVWLREFIKKFPQVQIQAFCTHFLKGSDFDNPHGYCAQQFKLFQSIEEKFPEIQEKHLFNTDSLFTNHQLQLIPSSYGARPGLSLYGYSSSNNEWTQKLKPVMTLKTKIVHLIAVSRGETVSYNATWKAQRDSLIAILPIGYADGYPRSLSNKGQVFIHGMRVPLVGIVCMDYLMIDVTEVKQVKLGDEVELWGRNISLEVLAQEAGTIVYELLSALTARVPRMILDEKV